MLGQTICKETNVNKPIFVHVDINYIRDKFEFLATQVKGKKDVLMILETKIHESFPKGNFLIDRVCKGGGSCYM